MKSVLRFAAAVACLASPAQGAALLCSSASRAVQGGTTLRTPALEFADFDEHISGMVEDPDFGLLPGFTASQRSTLRPEAITVTSSITGELERGTSLFHVTFTLDAPARYSLTGVFGLTGSSGFACVSFANLALPDTPLVNEIIFAPPSVAETRNLSFTGMLQPGDYLLEAMIYGGGDRLPTSGNLAIVLSIPEPSSSMLVACALLLLRPRCRSLAHGE